ncbi:Nucleotide-binding universal stress protein, UspA family [Pseudomonas linyingensis]|uniref:Nucleotide-binding universal stress protein, UspA family n=1 Tax=Pseudomonas linyingensis TaxID=915471 RepID=A0A1H7A822_9PSED|nr:universal stress protein [Pseudomonas linyingensis]SEJ61779.1 Nucleotide-binding universal stress protein, UspA family [Pseudomonas linyingensis]
MTPIRTVLAATDLSAPARQAVVRAASIAGHSGARLSLQHVVSRGALDALRQLFAAQPGDLRQRLLDEARDEVRELAAELCAAHVVSADIHLSAGNALAEITSHADALDADLLVLGARGASLVRDLMIGSTTERVLRKTGRPLLVVRGEAGDDYRRVLVPVDFSPRGLKAVALARTLAPQAEIVLLHAFEVPFEGRLRHAGVSEAELAGLLANARREAGAQMAELIAAAGLPADAVQPVIVHGDPSVHILDQEQLQGCELIVIGKRGQGALEELLLGSVTKHILSQAKGDVLVI